MCQIYDFGFLSIRDVCWDWICGWMKLLVYNYINFYVWDLSSWESFSRYDIISIISSLSTDQPILPSGIRIRKVSTCNNYIYKKSAADDEAAKEVCHFDVWNGSLDSCFIVILEYSAFWSHFLHYYGQLQWWLARDFLVWWSWRHSGNSSIANLKCTPEHLWQCSSGVAWGAVP
jgi:hypothetical protein